MELLDLDSLKYTEKIKGTEISKKIAETVPQTHSAATSKESAESIKQNVLELLPDNIESYVITNVKHPKKEGPVFFLRVQRDEIEYRERLSATEKKSILYHVDADQCEVNHQIQPHDFNEKFFQHVREVSTQYDQGKTYLFEEKRRA